MKLEIEDGVLYADGLHFCKVRPGNGRTSFPNGIFEVEVRTAPEHDYENLAFADGVGYFGGTVQHDIVVGRVFSRNGLIPCTVDGGRLSRTVETAVERGERVTLKVK